MIFDVCICKRRFLVHHDSYCTDLIHHQPSGSTSPTQWIHITNPVDPHQMMMTHIQEISAQYTSHTAKVVYIPYSGKLYYSYIHLKKKGEMHLFNFIFERKKEKKKKYIYIYLFIYK